MGSPTITNPLVRHMIAQNLRHLLHINEWSETELSRRSGVSQKQVNNIVRERYGCSVEAVFEMARAFKVPAYALLMPGLQESGDDLRHLDQLVLKFRTGNERLRRKLLDA
jgi:transcriptional regulator with XRE-family HTH domain